MQYVHLLGSDIRTLTQQNNVWEPWLSSCNSPSHLNGRKNIKDSAYVCRHGPAVRFVILLAPKLRDNHRLLDHCRSDGTLILSSACDWVHPLQLSRVLSVSDNDRFVLLYGCHGSGFYTSNSQILQKLYTYLSQNFIVLLQVQG